MHRCKQKSTFRSTNSCSVKEKNPSDASGNLSIEVPTPVSEYKFRHFYSHNGSVRTNCKTKSGQDTFDLWDIVVVVNNESQPGWDTQHRQLLLQLKLPPCCCWPWSVHCLEGRRCHVIAQYRETAQYTVCPMFTVHCWNNQVLKSDVHVEMNRCR